MKTYLFRKGLIACGLSLVLSACASTPQNTALNADGGSTDDLEKYQPMESQSLQDRRSAQAQALMDQQRALLAQTRLHFDFDQFGIKPEYQAVLQAHAEHLIQNPNQKMRLEGHADERGTREYNMALGERRSNTVAQTLVLMGVPQQQLDTTSLGEEQPLVIGRGEESFFENRRVELKYQKANRDQLSQNQQQNW